jgi:uncharacterized membrane protein YhaH (DUF805 family)
VLIDSGFTNFNIESVLIGNGVLPYIGANKLIGDMQYGQLIAGIGLLGACSIVLAVLFPSISFARKKWRTNNLDVTAVICTAFLTLLSALKGPYLLSRPLFDILIIILVFFTSGGSFGAIKYNSINSIKLRVRR